MSAACNAPGCSRSASRAGLCWGHYAQRRRGVPLRPLRGPHGQIGPEVCAAQVTAHVPDATYQALLSKSRASGSAVSDVIRSVLEAWATAQTSAPKAPVRRRS